MKNPLSLLLVSCVAWFGCGGAVQEPEATPVQVAAVEAPQPKKAPAAGEAPKDEKAAKAEAIAKALSELDIQMLGVLGQSEPVGILASGEVPAGMLEDAAASGGLDVGSHAGSADTGGGSISVGTGGGSVAVGGLPAVRGDARIGPVTVNNGTLANAEAAIGRYRSMFRSCYERALRTDPSQKGSLVVEIDVLTTGRVDDVRTAVVQGVNHDVTSCIEQRSRSMRFSIPSNDVTLAFQITLAPRSGGSK